jgi:LysR family transcriptional regulator, glycine cleavage system transcriptional activator
MARRGIGVKYEHNSVASIDNLLPDAIWLILAANTKDIYSRKMKPTHSSPSVVSIRALPPLTALLAFERAAKQLSFRRAAHDLALSPSAVSHQIRGLEERLGVKLFQRVGRTIRLTTDGERYLQTVGDGLAALDAGTRELIRRGQRSQSELFVSSLPFFTHTILIPSLTSFRRRHPAVTLHIEATHRYADFDHSPVDVAIRFGRERAEGLRLEPLVAVRSMPVCVPSIAKRELRTPSDLKRQVLIHVTQQPNAWPAWLSEAGELALTPSGELWFDTVPAALDAAEQGLGVALAMDPLINARKDFGKTLIAPFKTSSQRSQTIYLVTRPERSRDKIVEHFRRWIKGVMKTVAKHRD